VRLIGLAAAALVAAAACSAPAAAPSVRPAPSPPPEAEAMPAPIEDAETWLVARGFRCEPLGVEVGVAVRCVADDRELNDTYAVVDVLADDGGLITLVQATVDVGGAARPDLAGFLGFYASTVLGIVADPAPRAADAWLRGHVASPGSTVVGRLVLEMTVEPTRSSLRVWQRR